MIKNIVNRTVVNYALAFVGGMLAAKGLLPIELWDLIDGPVAEGILVAIGGGGVVAAFTAAMNGIRESLKDKVVIDGKRVELPKPGETLNGTKAEVTAAKAIVNEAGDRLVGRVK